MHRLLATSAELDHDAPSLSREALQHLRVVRPKPGEKVELFDGAGRKREFVFDGSALVAAGPVETLPRRPGELVLFACVTKGQRWDWTLEKATELGVTRIVPVISERTIVRLKGDERAAKRDRWRKICEEAARQSDAVWLPEMCEPVDFSAAAEMARRTKAFVGALVDPPPKPLMQALAGVGERDALSIFIGPEGDFTPAELAALLSFAVPVSLGPTILRAETAAIFALSVMAAARH